MALSTVFQDKLRFWLSDGIEGGNPDNRLKTLHQTTCQFLLPPATLWYFLIFWLADTITLVLIQQNSISTGLICLFPYHSLSSTVLLACTYNCLSGCIICTIWVSRIAKRFRKSWGNVKQAAGKDHLGYVYTIACFDI